MSSTCATPGTRISTSPKASRKRASNLPRISRSFARPTAERRSPPSSWNPSRDPSAPSFPPVGYLKRLREIADQHNILLIFDEVITGFGRTSSAFASQKFDVTPDIITMSKALTNGAVPMSAVAVKTEIQQTVLDAITADRPELMHGYT
ncbi:aminotransferase class III-fold pyridoxal phosphate-dependent enzyme [Breoghania sp.]|uniref:aminotransferase class III-fold pyridoxal phosphate-dependent enzyme n=1 Tax=Breoghania sp. TaxID=2065378 RepID=UPI00262D7CD9|nr:aminotransferase class III-fold pyridoxal phosphate-dependent enzyme [Breoghania sp.]MDJ0929750.1 aminotransferase class III-fold pyridoxal phosphate-dependent enzyme [Breoghania sp.]